MAALMIGITACSSDNGARREADAATDGGASANATVDAACETRPRTFEWDGHTYRSIQESTDEEPMMKLGWLDCQSGQIEVSAL